MLFCEIPFQKTMKLKTYSTVVPELKKVFFSLFRLSLMLLFFWIVFYLAYVFFPYIRPGDKIMYAAKTASARKRFSFPPQAAYKVLIFGDSKVLCGFMPAVFDSCFSGQVHSINAGLPEIKDFLFYLRCLIADNTIPTHILLTSPWKDTAENLKPDNMDLVFPFRNILRDFVLFLMRSRSYGGPGAFYRYGKHAEMQMVADRGYFFIEGQSHYPNHRLPDDFTQASDRPDSIAQRNILPAGPIFNELLALATRYDIKIVFIPTYYRTHQFAPVEAQNRASVASLAPYSPVRIAGPDYVQLDNRFFSDPNHVNPSGAALYTKAVCNLFKEAVAHDTKIP